MLFSFQQCILLLYAQIHTFGAWAQVANAESASDGEHSDEDEDAEARIARHTAANLAAEPASIVTQTTTSAHARPSRDMDPITPMLQNISTPGQHGQALQVTQQAGSRQSGRVEQASPAVQSHAGAQQAVQSHAGIQVSIGPAPVAGASAAEPASEPIGKRARRRRGQNKPSVEPGLVERIAVDVAPAAPQGNVEEAENSGDEQAHTLQPVRGKRIPFVHRTAVLRPSDLLTRTTLWLIQIPQHAARSCFSQSASDLLHISAFHAYSQQHGILHKLRDQVTARKMTDRTFA